MGRASASIAGALLMANAHAVDTGLSCQTIGMWDAPPVTDSASAVGTSVKVDVGINRDYGGIGVLFALNGVNVVEPRAATGGAWQTSNVVLDGPLASPTQYILFNQGAGNTKIGQWGYHNTYSGLSALDFNPLWADNVHPGSNTTINSPSGPCQAPNGYLFDYGKGQISTAVAPTSGHGNAVLLTNQYTFQSQVDQSWARWYAEQALYLNKTLARQKNLRIYLVGKDGWKEKVDPFAIHIAHGQLNVDPHCTSNCSTNWVVPGLKYAVLVWNIAGQDVGVAVTTSDPTGKGFLANLNRQDNGFACLDGSDRCGVVEWHTYVSDVYNASFPRSQLRTVAADYRVGTLQQLADWGFATEDAPACSSVTLTPSSLPAAGGTVSARANCTGSGATYAWTVNGSAYPGNLATNSSPVSPNTSTSTRTYQVCVTASNASGASRQVCAPLVQAAAAPTPAPVCSSISLSPASLTAAGGTVSAHASCSGSNLTYTWTVDGAVYAGNLATNSSPVAPNTTTSPKTYSICVTGQNAGGSSKVCTSLVEAGVSTAPPLCSSVTLTPNSLPATGGNVSARANCSGSGLTYAWTVNSVTYPGNLATNSSPVGPNTSSSPLFYAVCATASNAYGRSSSCAQLVEAGTAATAPVCSSLVLTPASLPASGGNVTAQANCTHTGDGLYYTWTVNGASFPGSLATNSSPVGPNATASPVSYAVCATAHDTNGQSAPVCATLLEAAAAVVLPSAPTVGTPVVVGSGAVSVPFTPGDIGTGTLVSYTASCGGTQVTGSGSPIVVTGLLSGTPYFCQVRATSTAGPGAWSLWSTDAVYP